MDFPMKFVGECGLGRRRAFTVRVDIGQIQVFPAAACTAPVIPP